MHPRKIVGSEQIRSGYNPSTTTAIPKGTVVKLGTNIGDIALPAADSDHIFGVTMHEIGPQQRGDVQIGGVAVVRADGAIASLHTPLMPTTGGRVKAWSAGAGANAALVGVNLITAGAQDDLIEVELAGPFAMKQG